MGFKRGSQRVATSLHSTPSFDPIYQRAVKHKGGEKALQALLPAAKSASALKRIGDDRYLSGMAKNIFRAGFVWKVVDNKWSGFEEVFQNFDIAHVACMDDRDIDEMATDIRVIRNRVKLTAVRDNARFIAEVASEQGGFGAYLANWPSEDLLGLWTDLHRRGSRLGGFTRAVFLREVGKDTFMLSGDVVRALVAAGIVDKMPTSKRDLRATQEAFNFWRQETGRSYCGLSRILAYSVG